MRTYFIFGMMILLLIGSAEAAMTADPLDDQTMSIDGSDSGEVVVSQPPEAGPQGSSAGSTGDVPPLTFTGEGCEAEYFKIGDSCKACPGTVIRSSITVNNKTIEQLICNICLQGTHYNASSDICQVEEKRPVNIWIILVAVGIMVMVYVYKKKKKKTEFGIE